VATSAITQARRRERQHTGSAWAASSPPREAPGGLVNNGMGMAERSNDGGAARVVTHAGRLGGS
jgi:hypothetical protein